VGSLTSRWLALKPGPLAAISPITPASSATAGEPIITNMDLRARDNKPPSPTYNITGELSRYQVTATGLRYGLATTFQGSVPSASEAHILIKYAGIWEISVREGVKNPQHLYGSPYQITVNPAATDPGSCISTFENTLVAGDDFVVTVAPFDSFSNPTSHPDDSFEAYFDSSPSTRFPLTRSSPHAHFAVSSPTTIASSYRLHVLHNDAEVANSPFNFDVTSASPSASQCEHSLEGITTFDPSTGANLTLQVFAFDEFKNLVPNTDRLIVVIDGDMNNAIPLLPPTYTHEFHFQPDETREIKIGVLLKKNGVTPLMQLPGSPLIIQVAPPPPPPDSHVTTENVYIGVFGLMFAVGLILVTKMLLTNSANDVDIMTTGAEMAGIMKSMATNTLDPITDFLSWYLVVSVCGGWVSNLYLVFVIVAFGATALSLYTSVKQLMFLSDYKEELDFGSVELEEEFVVLKKKYPESNIVAEGAKSLLSRLKMVTPVIKADEEEGEETEEQKEKRLLGLLKTIKSINLDIRQRERKMERVLSAVLQVRKTRERIASRPRPLFAPSCAILLL